MLQEKKILIVGGRGLIGSHLNNVLKSNNYQPYNLTRKRKTTNLDKHYFWNPRERLLDPDAVYNKEAVINLAGANILSKPWSNHQKQELYASRIETTKILANEFKKTSIKNRPHIYIAASAIGFYPSYNDMDPIANESTKPGDGFLGQLAKDWEAASMQIQNLGIRVVIMRLSIVLSPKGGAYPTLAKLAKIYLASPLGSGKQSFNWIHIDDLSSFILKTIQNKKWKGVYNLTSPEMPNNIQFTAAMNESFGRRTFLPHVPAIFLKMILGQRANLLLKGHNAVPEKLQKQGFTFKYPSLKEALRNLKNQST